MQTLNSLSASNCKIDPWIDAIKAFQKASTDAPTLESIRERILEQSLAKNRKKMVISAIDKIVMTSFPDLALPSLLNLPVSSSSSASAPAPVIPALSNLAAPALPPTAYTIMLGSVSRPWPNFRSEKRSLPSPLDLNNNNTLARLGTVIDHFEPIAKRSIRAPVIIAHMDRFIAGQDEALRILSLLAHVINY
jgi:hypothetical protein